MKDVGTVLLGKVYVVAKMVRGGGVWPRCTGDGRQHDISLCLTTFKSSCQFRWFMSSALHMPINVDQTWREWNLFFFFFLKGLFATSFTCFLENRNYLQMFSPGWRWFIVALLWRRWTDFCCGIKKKSQIIIQFHFRTVSELINDIFSLDALRVLETGL